MAKKIKVILDTNLWISFLITKNLSQLDEILFENKARLVFSEELLEEFLAVIKRPKLSKFFTNIDIEKLLEVIQEYSDFIEVKSKVKKCRDPKDDFLLSLGEDSKANFLITGDKDLLELKTHKKMKILTIKEFLNLEI